MVWTCILRVALGVAATAALATAQWSDGFEDYTDGSFLDGQGGWQGWNGNDTPFSVVTSNRSFEGSQSVLVLAGADTVQVLDGFESGKWLLRCMMYAPDSFRGKFEFAVMNAYADGGPFEASLQFTFDGDTMMLDCPCGDSTMPVTVPLVIAQWVELRLDIDLVNDLVDVFYDGVLLASYPWSSGVGGASHFSELAIEGINLFPNVNSTPHVSELYFDGFELSALGVSVGTLYCFGDGSGTTCPCGNSAAAEEGCANSTGVGGTLRGFGSNSTLNDDLVCIASQLLPGQPALLFAGLNATNGGAGSPFGDGLRCAGGAIVRLGVRIPDATGGASWGPGLAVTGGWTPTDTRRFQVWYRDPQNSPCGSFFNLTNGLEITFVL